MDFAPWTYKLWDVLVIAFSMNYSNRYDCSLDGHRLKDPKTNN